MKFRIPDLWSDEPPPGPTPAQKIKDAKGEERRVVKRLQGLVETHRESAQRMGVTLDAEDILAVVDALEAEAQHRDPFNAMKCSDEIRSYLRSGLYEEMLGEPSNVFLATPVSDDRTRYEAMPRAFWLGCLRALREEWSDEPPAASAEEGTGSSDVGSSA